MTKRNQSRAFLFPFQFVINGEELVIPQFVMGHNSLDAELPEVFVDLVRLTPHVFATHGLEGFILEERIGGIHECQETLAVVLHSQGKTDDAEPITGADDEGMFGPQSPDHAAI